MGNVPMRCKNSYRHFCASVKKGTEEKKNKNLFQLNSSITIKEDFFTYFLKSQRFWMRLSKWTLNSGLFISVLTFSCKFKRVLWKSIFYRTPYSFKWLIIEQSTKRCFESSGFEKRAFRDFLGGSTSIRRTSKLNMKILARRKSPKHSCNSGS